MAESERDSLEFIQAFRGVAALAVLLWHGSRYLAPYGTGVSGAVFLPGATGGADLFFVVSGFIMAHTTRRNDGSLRYFLTYAIKRLTRIWPLWALALLFFTVVVRRDVSWLSDAHALKSMIYSLLFLPLPGVAPTYGYPLLGVGWTLNYEIYFYGFFGLTLLFGRRRWVAFSAWILTALVVVPIAGGYAETWTSVLDPSVSYAFNLNLLKLYTNPLVWMFVAGVGINHLYHSSLRIRDPFYARLLYFAALWFTVWQFTSHFRTDHGILNWGLSLVPLVLLVAITSKTYAPRLPAWLLYLGDISFSLYLLHGAAQEGFDHFVNMLDVRVISEGYSAMFLTTMVSIMAAALSHRYIEVRLSGFLKRKALDALAAPRRSEAVATSVG